MDNAPLTPTPSIANGASVSGAIALPPNARNLSIYMPAAWTAAGMAVQFATTDAAPSAGDWRTWTDHTGEIALPAAANRVITTLDTIPMPSGAKWMRLVSGTVASQVVQAAQRDIPVTVRHGRGG